MHICDPDRYRPFRLDKEDSFFFWWLKDFLANVFFMPDTQGLSRLLAGAYRFNITPIWYLCRLVSDCCCSAVRVVGPLEYISGQNVPGSWLCVFVSTVRSNLLSSVSQIALILTSLSLLLISLTLLVDSDVVPDVQMFVLEFPRSLY